MTSLWHWPETSRGGLIHLQGIPPHVVHVLVPFDYDASQISGFDEKRLMGCCLLEWDLLCCSRVGHDCSRPKICCTTTVRFLETARVPQSTSPTKASILWRSSTLFFSCTGRWFPAALHRQFRGSASSTGRPRVSPAVFFCLIGGVSL